MKNPFPLLTFFALFQISLFAQCPSSANIILANQFDIDTFAANYPDCEYISGDLFIGEENSSSDITDLSALSSLQIIQGSLNLQNLDHLTSFNNSLNIDTILSGLVIQDCDSLRALNGLETLASVGYIYLTNNSSLTSIGAVLGAANNAQFLELRDNVSFTSLIDFIGITLVPFKLKVINSPELKSLEGLNDVKQFSLGLEFDNTGIKNLVGLDSVKSIGNFFFGGLELSNNDSLSSLDGLDNLEEIIRTTHIFNCPQLTSLSGLENVKNLSGSLRLYQTGISDLSALSSTTLDLTSIILEDNDELQSLNGIKLPDIYPGRISIKSNAKLNDINALKNLDEITSSLLIQNNPLLSDCSPICLMLKTGGVQGSVDISDNLIGCSSEEEVIELCTTGDKNEFQLTFNLYPSPVSDILYLNFGDPLSQPRDIIIHDINGRQILRQTISSNVSQAKIDVSMLNDGHYSVEVVTGVIKSQKRFIKKSQK